MTLSDVKVVSHSAEMTGTGVTHGRDEPPPPPPRSLEAGSHRRESHPLSSPATRRNLFLILFLIVDTLSLQRPRCLATKSGWTFFPIFCQGEAPPLSVPGGMIERSLHSSPCLTVYRLSFVETGSVCLCVCVCVCGGRGHTSPWVQNTQ